MDYDEIKAQKYNLAVTTYVDQEDNREKIDIKKLNDEIREIVKREATLREAVERTIALFEEVVPHE